MEKKKNKSNYQIFIFSFIITLFSMIINTFIGILPILKNLYEGKIFMGIVEIFTVLLFGTVAGYLIIKLYVKIFKKDFITFKKDE